MCTSCACRRPQQSSAVPTARMALTASIIRYSVLSLPYWLLHCLNRGDTDRQLCSPTMHGKMVLVPRTTCKLSYGLYNASISLTPIRYTDYYLFVTLCWKVRMLFGAATLHLSQNKRVRNESACTDIIISVSCFGPISISTL